MKTNSLINKETQVNTAYETAKFAMGTGITMVALVGIWGCACLVSIISSDGIGGVIKGFIMAITGA